MIGKKYAELSIPRVYCYGDTLCHETIEFLQENKLAMKHFHVPGHFFMLDSFDDFVDYVSAYITILVH
ncbi:MAG: hypothetical protein A3E83_08970 [Gammaproteobacteria bacterium RIFCSPHIGHO2_12_FULL_41_20]|nr:MAG: hypothetical protein A3E83_08970 [Gammaproteobacteria bacterium RIFCSPHIGHO2_12_FULL_41_20]